MKKFCLICALLSFTLIVQVNVSASADSNISEKTLMYVFNIAEDSTEESQDTPFSEKLTFNYTQNPDLKSWGRQAMLVLPVASSIDTLNLTLNHSLLIL